MNQKQRVAPEFRRVRQNEANAKFFVASGEQFSAPSAAQLAVGSTSGWF